MGGAPRSALTLVGTRGTGKRASDAPFGVFIQYILYTRICTADQHDQAATNHQRVDDGESDVLPGGVPFALLEDGEPEERGEVEGETADEQTGDDAEEVVEKGNGLGDHPGDESEHGDQRQPDDPALFRVDVAELGIREDAAHDVFADDGRVDTARDEDDGQREPERDARD